MFGVINRSILIARLGLKIKDSKFFDILLKMFEANSLFLLGILSQKAEVFQDHVLSPVLANIYFHELDLFVKESIIERYKKGVKPVVCSGYLRSRSFVDLKQRQHGFSKQGKEVRKMYG